MFINSNGYWTAIWRVDGRQKRKSLCTKDRTVALYRRDELFRELVAAGASWADSPRKLPADERVKRNPQAFIHQRKPFVVRVGKLREEADTLVMAKKIRDNFLKGGVK